MKKGRSNYTLQFSCDENKINQLMQSYLSANGFVSYEKQGRAIVLGKNKGAVEVYIDKTSRKLLLSMQ